MKNILIINGFQPTPYSAGQLNAAIIARMTDHLSASGYAVQHSRAADQDWDIDAEIEKHVWADAVIWQFPVNSMGVPWPLKKYMDEVYTAGMDGRMTAGDGRSRAAPKKNYGMGGTLGGTKYMISVTLNAPAEAFNDPSEPFFAGASVDDLLLPQHQNGKFYGMAPLPTFAMFDVTKNPQIDADFARLDTHLNENFPGA
ncbi:NAD(P)H-dependent oxidoreductase [Paracoccaceae bacterium GXU_MW_L88]